MKKLPLDAKKKLSRFLNWFDFGSLLFVVVGSFLGGFGGMMAYEHLGGDKQQKTVLQQKVDHLVTTYRLSQSMHTVVLAGDKGQDLGLDLARAREKAKALGAAFNAEAQATGIALAHAKGLSPQQRYELYKPLEEIQPKPAYFRSTKDGAESFVLFNMEQGWVSRHPGFTPSVESATAIANAPHLAPVVILGSVLGPLALGIGAAFGFCALRGRLDKSIKTEEKAIREAEDAARRAEAKRKAEEAAAERARKAAETAQEKARKAAEAAEAERLAKLPPSVELDRDISIRPIKLAGKGGPSGS